MEEGLRIGQVAELAGVSVKTVRHYEQIGVLDEPPRAPNGYRMFPPEAVLRVAHAARLRSLGLPLTTVRAALEARHDGGTSVGSQLDALVGYLTEERERLDQRIAALRTLAAALDATSDVLEADGSQVLGALRDALGDHAERIPPEVWQIEGRVAGIVAALAESADGGLPPGVVALARDEPSAFVELMEADAALAALADATPDDPRVEEVAERLRRGQAMMQRVVAAMPPPSSRMRAAIQTVMAPRVNAAQQRALQLALQLGKEHG